MAANHEPAGTSSGPATAEDPLVLAHLSDTHLDGGARSQARAQQVMDYLEALPGELAAIVVTGDITDNGLPAEWEQAGKVLTSQRFPVLTCPGNHDGYSSYEWPLNRSHDLGGAVLVLVDSVIPGRSEGRLGEVTLAWLESTLEQLGGRRVLLGLHHPPVQLHQPWIDEIRLGEAERLAAVLQRHPQVAAVLCGHAHTAGVATFAGRPVLVAPGVASTLCLPWEIDGPPAWKNSLDFAQPPGVAFHVLTGDGRLTTHFRVVTDDGL